MRRFVAGAIVSVAVALAGPGCKKTCEPSCRADHVCVEGTCVSKCNPPCESGEKCTADARCMTLGEIEDEKRRQEAVDKARGKASTSDDYD